MVHSAYDSFELLRDCPSKIESIESYGSKLLLGCSDGYLRVYASKSLSSDPDYHHTPHELRKDGYMLERNLAGFAKKPVLSMEVLESRDLLLSLSESIAFHRLPNFETLAVITKAKGANVFCWDDRRGFLSFARQKRVCIFRHDGNSVNSIMGFRFSNDNYGGKQISIIMSSWACLRPLKISCTAIPWSEFLLMLLDGEDLPQR